MPKKTFFQLPPEKKQRIIEAGYDEFIENEYEDINIRGIAKRCGISIGSFYQYFEDKDEFYLYLIATTEEKLLHEEKKISNFIMFREKLSDIEEVFNEKEVKFNRTWYNAPIDVMRKLYFGKYFDNIKMSYIEELKALKEEGKLRDSVEIELFAYMYTTSMFNILLYFRENNITDENERLKIKKKYFREILPYGIYK